MTLPPFLRFAPVPLKSRHDGWSAELQLRFIVALARGFPIGRAARLLGKSRTTAYALRERPGAESFAAAWDDALAYGKRARIAAAAAPAAAPAPRPSPAAPPAATPAEAAARARAAEAIIARYYPDAAGKAGEDGQAGKAGKAGGARRS